MKRLWIDATVGVAGDMLLSALIDAGADVAAITKGLQTVVPDEDWTIAFEPVQRRGMRGLHLTGREPADHAAHRPYAHVRGRIENAALPARAQARALAVYGLLAHAEARIHGVDVDDVELHEVGSTDAILDIVGVCLALEQLDIDDIVATALPMGTGTVQTAHGPLPLPAPATVEVLKGWPVEPARWPGEWVTPTGAALIAGLAEHGPPPAMVIDATGFGAGTRDSAEVANLVRVIVGHDERTFSVEDTVVELAANIDDMPGEHVPPLLQRMLAEGALDAWATAMIMKKGRPGLCVQALTRPEDAERLSDVLLRHSSTLGVRRNSRQRRVLDRWMVTVKTKYGDIRVKVAGRGGRSWHMAPEFEDVARCANTHDAPLFQVHNAAIVAAAGELD